MKGNKRHLTFVNQMHLMVKNRFVGCANSGDHPSCRDRVARASESVQRRGVLLRTPGWCLGNPECGARRRYNSQGLGAFPACAAGPHLGLIQLGFSLGATRQTAVMQKLHAAFSRA